MRAMMMFAAAAILTGCTGPYEPRPLTPKQASALEKALTGKVAGEKVACISQIPRTDMRVISDSVLLYRVSGRLIYRNDLIGSCNGLTRGDTLITRSFGSQYCRGDIANVANLQTGTRSGGCALGDFTPYRTPKK